MTSEESPKTLRWKLSLAAEDKSAMMTTEARTSSAGSRTGASIGRDQAYLSKSLSRVEDPSPRPGPGPSPSLMTQQESQEELKKHRRDLLDSRKDMLTSMNAYSVVLVLLASVTFVGFLQPPGGLKQDENAADGTATNGTAADVGGTLQRTGFHMDNFIVPLTISFYLAVAGILICMRCTIFVLRLPQKTYRSDSDRRSSLKKKSHQSVSGKSELNFGGRS